MKALQNVQFEKYMLYVCITYQKQKQTNKNAVKEQGVLGFLIWCLSEV